MHKRHGAHGAHDLEVTCMRAWSDAETNRGRVRQAYPQICAYSSNVSVVRGHQGDAETGTEIN